MIVGVILLPYRGMGQLHAITKHLGGEVRRLEVLLCYNCQNGVTNEEENIIFGTKPKLFSIEQLVYLRYFNM